MMQIKRRFNTLKPLWDSHGSKPAICLWIAADLLSELDSTRNEHPVASGTVMYM